MGQEWVKKVVFQKSSSTIWGDKQVEWALFEPTASHFGHSKSQNALKMRCFGTKKWVKNGSKTCFSKEALGLFGVHKQVE